MSYNVTTWDRRFYETWVFRFKLALIVHFLSVCVVLAVASGERVGLSTIKQPEAARTKINERRKKQV